MAKLHAKITNEEGKTASKGGNANLVIDLNIGNVEIGRVVVRYEECNGTTIYYYPINKGGRTLLHKIESKKQQSECNLLKRGYEVCDKLDCNHDLRN